MTACAESDREEVLQPLILDAGEDGAILANADGGDGTDGSLRPDGGDDLDSAIPDGAITDGATADGAIADGAIADGAIADGAILDAAIPDGAIVDGGIPDGAVIDGAVIDGAIPDGALPDGAIPDGAMADGATVDGGPTDPFEAPVFPVAVLLALRTEPCVAYRADRREECAVATYRRFVTEWMVRHGTVPAIGDVLTAVYRGELATLDGWGASVRALAGEAFARFFWRTMGGPDITPERLVVFLGAMHAWYLYGPDFMRIREAYYEPGMTLRNAVHDAIVDADHRRGAVAGRPVDWANWGQGRLGFADFRDGIVEGEPVPLVIRYCSVTDNYDYYFALLAPGQPSSTRRPPSTAGVPVPGDPTCGIYIQNCPACR